MLKFSELLTVCDIPSDEIYRIEQVGFDLVKRHHQVQLYRALALTFYESLLAVNLLHGLGPCGVVGRSARDELADLGNGRKLFLTVFCVRQVSVGFLEESPEMSAFARIHAGHQVLRARVDDRDFVLEFEELGIAERVAVVLSHADREHVLGGPPMLERCGGDPTRVFAPVVITQLPPGHGGSTAW